MQIEQSEIFRDWLFKLKDKNLKGKILSRLDSIEEYNYFGIHKNIGEGIWEMKFDYGAGYRIYYSIKENIIVLLLCGGDKSTQQKDIKKAKVINDEWRIK